MNFKQLRDLFRNLNQDAWDDIRRMAQDEYGMNFTQEEIPEFEENWYIAALNNVVSQLIEEEKDYSEEEKYFASDEMKNALSELSDAVEMAWPDKSLYPGKKDEFFEHQQRMRDIEDLENGVVNELPEGFEPDPEPKPEEENLIINEEKEILNENENNIWDLPGEKPEPEQQAENVVFVESTLDNIHEEQNAFDKFVNELKKDKEAFRKIQYYGALGALDPEIDNNGVKEDNYINIQKAYSLDKKDMKYRKQMTGSPEAVQSSIRKLQVAVRKYFAGTAKEGEVPKVESSLMPVPGAAGEKKDLPGEQYRTSGTLFQRMGYEGQRNPAFYGIGVTDVFNAFEKKLKADDSVFHRNTAEYKAIISSLNGIQEIEKKRVKGGYYTSLEHYNRELNEAKRAIADSAKAYLTGKNRGAEHSRNDFFNKRYNTIFALLNEADPEAAKEVYARKDVNFFARGGDQAKNKEFYNMDDVVRATHLEMYREMHIQNMCPENLEEKKPIDRNLAFLNEKMTVARGEEAVFDIAKQIYTPEERNGMAFAHEVRRTLFKLHSKKEIRTFLEDKPALKEICVFKDKMGTISPDVYKKAEKELQSYLNEVEAREQIKNGEQVRAGLKGQYAADKMEEGKQSLKDMDLVKAAGKTERKFQNAALGILTVMNPEAAMQRVRNINQRAATNKYVKKVDMQQLAREAGLAASKAKSTEREKNIQRFKANRSNQKEKEQPRI